MNIAIVGLNNFPKNKKVKIPDKRLKVLQQIFKSKEIVPATLFFLSDDKLKDCEGIICSEGEKISLIINDMDFIEKKLADLDSTFKDKELFEKALKFLEEEKFLFEAYKDGSMTGEEINRLAQYPIYTVLPVIVLHEEASLEDLPEFWWQIFGRGVFFTAGTKDSHAWLFRLGQTAVECAGIIHTEIAKGFVRAEVAPYSLLVELGSISAVRQQGKLKIEGKDYKIQEGDWVLFRTTG